MVSRRALKLKISMARRVGSQNPECPNPDKAKLN